jgi:anti-sigma regulatory factor (Ser/Thr protein kinase)
MLRRRRSPGIGDPVAPPGDLVLRLRAHVESVRAARHAVDRLPGLDDYPEQVFNLRLLVTELVANCVTHAGLGNEDVIVVDLDMQGPRVRVAVTDPGPGFRATPPSQPPGGMSGRGLFLVDALSSRWGVERGGGDTTVWFEIDL